MLAVGAAANILTLASGFNRHGGCGAVLCCAPLARSHIARLLRDTSLRPLAVQLTGPRCVRHSLESCHPGLPGRSTVARMRLPWACGALRCAAKGWPACGQWTVDTGCGNLYYSSAPRLRRAPPPPPPSPRPPVDCEACAVAIVGFTREQRSGDWDSRGPGPVPFLEGMHAPGPGPVQPSLRASALLLQYHCPHPHPHPHPHHQHRKADRRHPACGTAGWEQEHEQMRCICHNCALTARNDGRAFPAWRRQIRVLDSHKDRRSFRSFADEMRYEPGCLAVPLLRSMLRVHLGSVSPDRTS